MNIDSMNRLVEDFARGSTGDLVITADAEGFWIVSLGNQSLLTLEWADQPPRLISTVHLGKVDEHRRTAVYEVLLTYNRLWQETAGIRMALDGPEGEVVLLHELSADALTVVDLSAALARVCHVSSGWRRFVAAQEPVHAAAP